MLKHHFKYVLPQALQQIHLIDKFDTLCDGCRFVPPKTCSENIQPQIVYQILKNSSAQGLAA